MSIEEIKNAVEELSLDERRQLTAFLVSLRHRGLAEYKERITRKIDSDAEGDFVTFEEFDKRISA